MSLAGEDINFLASLSLCLCLLTPSSCHNATIHITPIWGNHPLPPGSFLEGFRSYFTITLFSSTLMVLELKTLQCRKQTHEGQRKSWQGNFFWSKGCKHVLAPAEWTCKHKRADSSFSLYPQSGCTAPYLGFVQVKVHSLSWLPKRLGGWVRAHNLAGNFWGQWSCTRIQRKKQEPFKQHKSPKMAT
jgi:hypothetical protein